MLLMRQEGTSARVMSCPPKRQHMVKVYRASDSEGIDKQGYSAKYVADIVFRSPVGTAGVILVNLAAGKRTAPHSHSHLDELFVASGPARIGVDAKVHDLETGDVLLVERSEVHWMEAPADRNVTLLAMKLPNIKTDKVDH